MRNNKERHCIKKKIIFKTKKCSSSQYDEKYNHSGMDDYKKKNLIGITHMDEKNGDNIIRSVCHVCIIFWGQTLDTPFENCYLSSKHLLYVLILAVWEIH